MTTFTFHSDPGHGWLAVNISQLENLNILHKITSYSYIRGNTVYLEEDCDYGIFLEAAKKANLPVSIKESYKDKSPIRSYSNFSFEYLSNKNKIVKGATIYLYNSSTNDHSVEATIEDISGNNVFIVDCNNNRYKPLSKERLLKSVKFQ